MSDEGCVRGTRRVGQPHSDVARRVGHVDGVHMEVPALRVAVVAVERSRTVRLHDTARSERDVCLTLPRHRESTATQA